MKKFFLLLFILSISLYPAEKVKIRELYESGEKYNGKAVIVEGEVIGDLMGKGEERWINIKDESEDFAIGIIISKKEIEKIKNFGRYRIKGDVIKVLGIYNINCPKHYGERDIHALNIEIIKKGEKYKEEVNIKKIYLSFLLLSITLFIAYLYHKEETSREE
jgi:hypothetical protein